jgi:hypothetical protein
VLLYAAYGLDLDPSAMGTRCPSSPVRGPGWLTGWRLTFGGEDRMPGSDDGALATIVQDPGASVYVLLYDVSDLDAAALRIWDQDVYRTLKVRVETLEGSVMAWTFVLDAYEGGLPGARYLGGLADAAEAAGAPADYVHDLRQRPCRSND